MAALNSTWMLVALLDEPRLQLVALRSQGGVVLAKRNVQSQRLANCFLGRSFAGRFHDGLEIGLLVVVKFKAYRPRNVHLPFSWARVQRSSTHVFGVDGENPETLNARNESGRLSLASSKVHFLGRQKVRKRKCTFLSFAD